MILIKVISGGQNGADIAGVRAAKSVKIATGGTMPKGFKTLDGPKPEYAELYGMVEHSSDKYPPRTYQNVMDATGTIRFAVNFDSAGEKCTFKAIMEYGKPYFDVHVKNTRIFTASENEHPEAVARWIVENKITVLNVAGNSEKTAPGIEKYVERFLIGVFNKLSTTVQTQHA